jgi:hypothetical protein
MISKKIKGYLDVFEQQLICNGYSYEKDTLLFNALNKLRRQLE